MKMNHIPVTTVFAGVGKFGDWEWMQEHPGWAHTLFVFNDNEEQFDAYRQGLSIGYTAGAGNALARPWRKFNPPKSAGIPTGKKGSGYNVLDEVTKEKIDQALTVVYDLLKTFYYNYLVFSADESERTLGISTFHVDEQVRQYIFDRLNQTPDEWRHFIDERAKTKFRLLSAAINDAKANGLSIDSSNTVVQQHRDEMAVILRIKGK
jgi:hypothetical protein